MFVIVLYYVLPAAAALLLFASLRLEPLHRLRVFTACASVAASMYAAEFFLLTFLGTGPIKPVLSQMADASDKRRYAGELTKTFGGSIDIRTAAEVLADLRSRNVDAIPSVTASNQLLVDRPDGSLESSIRVDGREVIPLGSVSNRVTLLCNEGGQWIDYRSDSRGFNNTDETWRLNHLDIAAVGDSFAHGYCVPADRNFMALIHERFRATLNLGVAGDGPLLMLATLSEYLPRFRPKTVLWFYYEGNDLVDLQKERRSGLLANYLSGDYRQEYLSRQGDIDRAIVAELPRLAATDENNRKRRRSNQVVSTLLQVLKLTSLRQRLGLVRETDRSSLETAVDFETDNLEVFREVLQRAQTQVAGWDGQLYFVYLPEWTRYTNYRSLGELKREEVLNLVRGLGLPIIDIDPVFRAHGDPLSLFPFRGLGHYTEAGHRLVAEEVLRSLTGVTGSIDIPGTSLQSANR